MITAFGGQVSVMALGKAPKSSHKAREVQSLTGCYSAFEVTDLFFCLLFYFLDTWCEGRVIFKTSKFIVVLQCKVYF